MSGAEIYQCVKDGKSSVATMHDDALRDLLGHLGRKGKISGTAGKVWGLCLVESAMRFVRQGRRPEVARSAADYEKTEVIG